jgi:prepilin-type N-terminal cleavage/methylation domain-containing protein
LVKRSGRHNETHNHLKFFCIKLKNSLKTRPAGFTLIEVMIVIAIAGVLASISLPNYIKYREKARIEVTITEIRFIEKEIANFVINDSKLPDDLSQI